MSLFCGGYLLSAQFFKVVLGYLDVRFDVLRHGKIIGCNLIELGRDVCGECHLRLVDEYDDDEGQKCN